MVVDGLHIHDLLQGVVKDVVPRDLEEEALAVAQALSNSLVPEGSHQKVIRVHLPLDFVVPLQHARLIVGSHQPVELARIELGRVREGHVLVDLGNCSVRPLSHEHAQVKVVVDCVIMKLFLLDLVCCVFES